MKVFNFGSLNIDYVYIVSDFVCSGETISAKEMTVFPGGKGLNQSVALARAGAKVCHCGFVSIDAGFLVEVLEQNGIDISMLQIIQETNGHAIIQVNDWGQNCILLYGGSNLLIDKPYVERIAKQIGRGDILLMQNETSSNDHMLTAAKSKGAFVVLNPSPMNNKCSNLPLDLVDLFILNEEEGRSLTGYTESKMILNEMRMRFPGAEILLTLGKRGVIYDGCGEHFELPIYDAGSVVDTTAAGDTFTGYFLADRIRGKTSRAAAQLATKAAGLAVTRSGASPSIPSLSEVKSL